MKPLPLLLLAILSTACPQKEPQDTSRTDTGESGDSGHSDHSDSSGTDTGVLSPECRYTNDVMESEYVINHDLGGEWDSKSVIGLTNAGDLTGDGQGDLVVELDPWDSMTGQLYNFILESGVPPEEVRAIVDTQNASLATGADLDGDGFGDLSLSHDAYEFSIFMGPLTAGETTPTFEIDLIWETQACHMLGGDQLIGDLNNDGRDEWLLEDWGDSDGGGDPCELTHGDYGYPNSAGAAYILNGPLHDGQDIQTEYSAKLIQPLESSGGLLNYTGDGDVDGDGVGDLVVFSPPDMLVVSGPIEGYQLLSEIARAAWAPEAEDNWEVGGFHPSVVGDWNDDGFQEVLLPTWKSGLETIAYVLPGDTAGGVASTLAATTIDLVNGHDSMSNANLALDADRAADLDGDGASEVLIGLEGRCEHGRSYLVPYPGDGHFYLDGVASVVYGRSEDPNSGRGLGFEVIGDLDFDLDDRPDVILGDQNDAVYVVSGGGL